MTNHIYKVQYVETREKAWEIVSIFFEIDLVWPPFNKVIDQNGL